MLAAMDEPGSRDGALKAVLDKWDVQMTTPVDLKDAYPFFRIAARQHGLDALRVRGNLNVIRKLNLPAILECSLVDGGGTRFLALVGMSLDSVQLSVGGSVYSRPPLALVGLWNGVAYVLWKNHFNYAGVIPISSPGEEIISLKAHLRTLGFPIEAMTPAYDIATRQAVETIQARNGLDVDGMVGPLTKIVLYNMDPSLTIPRLNPGEDLVTDGRTTEEAAP